MPAPLPSATSRDRRGPFLAGAALLAVLAASPAAWADTLTLDTGAVLDGHLTAYDHAGSCELVVASGELAGALVVLPCHRLLRMERTADPTLGAGAPVAVQPLPAVAPPAGAEGVVDSPAATAPLVVAGPEPEPVALADGAAADPGRPPAAAAAPAPPPAETAPAETAPAEPAPAVTAPAETAPAETAPAETGWRAALPPGLKLPELGRRRE